MVETILWGLILVVLLFYTFIRPDWPEKRRLED